MAVVFPPPFQVIEYVQAPLQGVFFFWLQRGLVVGTGLQRLTKCRNLVSEPFVSLSDRPSARMGRIKSLLYFQYLAIFVRPACSEVRPVTFREANPGDGRIPFTRALA